MSVAKRRIGLQTIAPQGVHRVSSIPGLIVSVPAATGPSRHQATDRLHARLQILHERHHRPRRDRAGEQDQKTPVQPRQGPAVAGPCPSTNFGGARSPISWPNRQDADLRVENP